MGQHHDHHRDQVESFVVFPLLEDSFERLNNVARRYQVLREEKEAYKNDSFQYLPDREVECFCLFSLKFHNEINPMMLAMT